MGKAVPQGYGQSGLAGGKILINHTQRGKGRDIIFLHGWGGSTASFSAAADVLSGGFRTTLVDFYGFGKTPSPGYPLRLDDFADSVADVVKYYGMREVTLVGHSFGGRVAVRVASKYGRLLNSLVLVDSAGIRPRRGLRYYGKIYSHKLKTFLGIPHEAGSEDYRKLDDVGKQTFKNIVNEDLSRELYRITLPTLLIWGDKDRETPIYMAKRMYGRIAGSGLIILEGAGHFSYLEAHGLFCAVLAEFVSGGGYGSDYYCGNCFSKRGGIVEIPLFKPKQRL